MNTQFVQLPIKGRKWAIPALLITFLLGTQNSFSQDTTELDEVVVIGTKFEIPVEKSGKTIYKLSQQDLERNAGKSVADILNEVPGIQMDGNFGSPGTNISYFVRGASSKNTLILIDGLPINDPSNISSTYDLRLLSLNQVESIEVLKGGLSTLYGTGASAAVINIKLKESKGNKPFGGSVDFNAGSFGTYNGNLSFNGKKDKFSYLVSGNFLTSEGFSSASDEQATIPFGKDGLDRKNALLKLGYEFSEKFNLDFFTGYDDMEADYDQGTFADADFQQINNQLRFGITPSYKYAKGKVSLKSVYNLNEREFISNFPSEYKGRNLQIDLTQEHNILPGLKGLWGVNLQQFSYEQPGELDFKSNKFTLVDPYASFFYEAQSGFNLHAGARVNTHSEYDHKFIYNVNPSYYVPISSSVSLKVLASISTSYITPSLYQINSPQYGNDMLNPEESLNYEQGVSLYVGKEFTLNLVHFTRDETSPIDFVSIFDEDGSYIGGQYQNTEAERSVEGFEADFSWTPNKYLDLSGHYAHVNTDKPSTFYRVPKNKWGWTVNAQPIENTEFSLKYNFTGKRTFYDFSEGEMELEGFGLVDLYIQRTLLENKLRVYGAINNLIDEEFTAIYGYTTRGRTFSLGAQYQF
ncbi:TonB-dependent receptor [Echinicola jeungdonensis]|uniref:TonB-dependent receptor plug domain-containing protein n=1 Tax=Echinicola jeungdonensis TaxID=709343 RepID=A0ABV5J848_9BACT|nr:TonB-dependent receptor plug domain-containing protein [Echinicola jeungdonensis]MDN3671027.1 TonB-dependent receptor [Echinicola jeungdonensis]